MKTFFQTTFFAITSTFARYVTMTVVKTFQFVLKKRKLFFFSSNFHFFITNEKWAFRRKKVLQDSQVIASKWLPEKKKKCKFLDFVLINNEEKKFYRELFHYKRRREDYFSQALFEFVVVPSKWDSTIDSDLFLFYLQLSHGRHLFVMLFIDFNFGRLHLASRESNNNRTWKCCYHHVVSPTPSTDALHSVNYLLLNFCMKTCSWSITNINQYYHYFRYNICSFNLEWIFFFQTSENFFTK